MFLVGLTGGIGSGKSTVATEFGKHGITVIDADNIARDILSPDSPVTQKVIEHFGNKILQNDTIDRKALREIIFQDQQEKLWLNQLLHPIIRTQMSDQALKSNTAYTICVVPLLFENQLTGMYHRILVVDCAEDIQIARIVARDNVDINMARAMIKAQASRATRLAGADDVIENTGDLIELNKLVLKLHNRYLEISKKSN